MENKKLIIFLISIFVIFLVGFFMQINSVYAEDSQDIVVTSSGGKNPVVTYPFLWMEDKTTETIPIILVKNPETNEDYNKITYNYNGNTNEKREYNNIAVGGSFSFKDKKLVEAQFETTADSEYSFGNQKIKVPQNSKVIFRNNKVTIELPKDAIIQKPTRIADASKSKDPDVDVEYKYAPAQEPSAVKIKEDAKEYEIKKFGNQNFQLNYDGKVGAFRVDGKFEMNGLKVGEFTKEDKTYLFFDGKNHDDLKGSYISLGDKKIFIGAFKGEFGSTVQFLPGNGVLSIGDKKLVMVQAIGGENGGHITIESRDSESKIPKITATEGYNLFSGDKVLKYIDSFKEKSKGPILLTKNPIGDSAKGKEAIPLQIVTLDRSGTRLGDWDAVVDSFGNIKAGTAKELEAGEVSVRQGVVTSARVNFQSLTQEEQTKFGTLTPERRKTLIAMDAQQIKTELGKTLIIEPAKTTTPTANNPTSKPNVPIKSGDPMKEADKKTIKNLLGKSGITYPTSSNLAGKYNEEKTSDGKTIKGYVIPGDFIVRSNSWGTEQVQKIFVTTNSEVYLWKTSSCNTRSGMCQYNWVRYK